ncbi:MAG TPA: hypothetical protein VF060_35325 [Trebonia sp.]
MEGRWCTTSGGSSSGHLAILAAIAAVLLGSGAAAAVTSAIIITVIIAGGLLALGLVVLVAYRIRSESKAPRPVPVRQLPRAERPAIEQDKPRELHTHYHLHGLEPEQLAEILRRGQRPE